MLDYEFTKHAVNMIYEREIDISWLENTIDNPDKTEFINNEEIHYIKQIKEFGNRYFRVFVNPYSRPQKIITMFFDRRIKE